ncbi:MAG: DUF1848 domain-containing protein [Spirochaetaceae bacterium]|nr:DUF1848 domain-containing protein [Spirochaetaceae bacterium]
MIISASRRTDIPAYYSEWFFNRIKERFVYIRNPVIRQISKINIEPELVDCIVFWSKNPEPLISGLNLIKEYAYYFQFTLNPYDSDIETGSVCKNKLIETFKKLSDATGPQKVIWRYDPVLLNKKYNILYHIDKFYEFAGKLKGYAEKVTFSFMDFYKKTEEAVKSLGINEITNEEKNTIAANFSLAAKENNFDIDSCAEDIDLSKYNISHAKCIDAELITKITGNCFSVKKDKNQRHECGCVESIDIGEYNSCLNGCVYCYANRSQSVCCDNFKTHNPFSALLTGEANSGSIVKERKMLSLRVVKS